MQCWKAKAEDRPTFEQLQKTFETMVSEYVDPDDMGGATGLAAPAVPFGPPPTHSN